MIFRNKHNYTFSEKKIYRKVFVLLHFDPIFFVSQKRWVSSVKILIKFI